MCSNWTWKQQNQPYTWYRHFMNQLMVMYTCSHIGLHSLTLKGHWTSIIKLYPPFFFFFFFFKVGIFISLVVYWHHSIALIWLHAEFYVLDWLTFEEIWLFLAFSVFQKLIKGKRIGRISWKFWHCFNLKSSTESCISEDRCYTCPMHL